MTGRSKQLRSIQSGRAIAALLVVLHHLSLRVEQRTGGLNFLAPFDHFGFAGVDLFFVISGLIMVVTCQHHFGRFAAAPQFLWRRITRIYPLYWIFTSIQLALLIAIPTATDRSISLQNAVASFLLFPQSVYPILAPGWTLIYEMFFYILFAFLFFIPKRFASFFLFTWAVFTLVIYSFQETSGLKDTTDLLQLPVYGSPMTLEFLAGCLIGALYKSQVHDYARLSLSIGLVWFLCGWFVIESLTGYSAEFGLARVLAFGTASAFILYGLISIEATGASGSLARSIAHPWLVKLGDASYSLYLSHLLVINALAIVWKKLAINHSAAQLIYEAVILISCILFALYTYRMIERPILHWLRIKSANENLQAIPATK